MSQVKLVRLSEPYANGSKVIHAVDLEINDPEFMVYVGPAGCRALAVASVRLLAMPLQFLPLMCWQFSGAGGVLRFSGWSGAAVSADLMMCLFACCWR